MRCSALSHSARELYRSLAAPTPRLYAQRTAAAGVGRSQQHNPASSSRHAAGARLKARAIAIQDGGIYANPGLYDDVFSYRDYPKEVEFIQQVYDQVTGNKALNTVLEIGCGPAQHLLRLIQDTPSMQGWALDKNATMLEYAQTRAAAAGISNATFIEGDMAGFHIKGWDGKLDLVLCMLGTLSHLTDNGQAVNAFTCVAAHLRPGGLFIVEVAHPGDLFDGSLMLGDGGTEMWEVKRGTPQLLVEWGSDMDGFDVETQVLQRTFAVSSMKDGEVSEHLLEDVMPYRQYTAQEIDLLGRMAGLEVAGTYGDLNLQVGLRHEDAYRMVVVLRKR